MIREVSKLSEHFRCIALSELPLDRAADTQFQALARFGPVSTKQLTSWHDVFSWLQPLRTFPRHFIVAEIGNWSLVMCDMIGEHCLVDILFHSRLFGCRAVGGIALPFERRFFYIEKGEHVRDVECFREGKWFFRERGTPLSLEDPRVLSPTKEGRATSREFGFKLYFHADEYFVSTTLRDHYPSRDRLRTQLASVAGDS